MKNTRFLFFLAIILTVSVAALASPIFGTWKGELNGRPITISVTYVDRHTDVKMTSTGGDLATSNASFPKGGPPMLLRFQSANQDGKMKLVSTAGPELNYELETANGQEATLRVIDQGKTVATVRMTKDNAK